MNTKNLVQVNDYLATSIATLHSRRAAIVAGLHLDALFLGNPFLQRLDSHYTVGEYIEAQLTAFLAPKTEDLLGDSLKGLAILVAELAHDGYRSTTPGVDLEFTAGGTHFLISVKMQADLDNNSKRRAVARQLGIAASRMQQQSRQTIIQPVVGICYGRAETGHTGSYLRVVGRDFWYLLSCEQEFYTEIIELIGQRMQLRHDEFCVEYARTLNRMTAEFYGRFCDTSGAIDWVKLVAFNNGNYDLDKFLA